MRKIFWLAGLINLIAVANSCGKASCAGQGAGSGSGFTYVAGISGGGQGMVTGGSYTNNGVINANGNNGGAFTASNGGSISNLNRGAANINSGARAVVSNSGAGGSSVANQGRIATGSRGAGAGAGARAGGVITIPVGGNAGALLPLNSGTNFGVGNGVQFLPAGGSQIGGGQFANGGQFGALIPTGGAGVANLGGIAPGTRIALGSTQRTTRTVVPVNTVVRTIVPRPATVNVPVTLQ
jgi:hypothetical protein